MCLSLGLLHMSTVPTTVKEDDTLEIELQLAVSLFSVAPSLASCGCWGLNLGPRQEQCVLLASGPLLWLLSHRFYRQQTHVGQCSCMVNGHT